MALAGDGFKLVERPVTCGAQQADAGFAVGLASNFLGSEEGLARHQAAGVYVWQSHLRWPCCNGVVRLVNVFVAEQGVISIALMQAFAQQHQACGFPVNAVQGHQVGASGQAFELHQQALLHIAPAGGDGHEMRFVGHQQVIVFKHDARLHGQDRFIDQVAVVIKALTRLAGLVGQGGLTAFLQDQALLQALCPFAARDAGHACSQKIEHIERAGWWDRNHAGAHAIAHGQLRPLARLVHVRRGGTPSPTRHGPA